MADPITREQIERAIVGCQRESLQAVADAFGGSLWVKHAPQDVRDAWFGDGSGWGTDQAERLGAALTRWRDELAAAEPVRGLRTIPPWTCLDCDRAPRFKVGDWVRRTGNAGCKDPFQVAFVVGEPGDYCYGAEGSRAPTVEWALEPASPPAPEVVDVLQPETWHARLVRLAQEAQAAGAACAEAEAAFAMVDAEREKARKARAAAREVCHAKRQALTEATTAASIICDAQQGGAS